jgi:putative peptide zinc metalloprotease protein
MPTYTRETLITVHPFSSQPDGEDVIIGRKETGVFLAVPPEAVEVLDYLAQGKSVGEVADLYQQRHGEVPDLDDFLGLMESKGIVKPSGDERRRGSDSRTLQAPAAQRRYHFENFPQSVAQRLFGRPLLVIYFLLIALGLVLIAVDPWLRPGPRDWYFPDHRTLTWSLLILASYATIFVHEMGHLVAARALGINSRLGISHRLWYMVAETDLSGLWTVAKQQRFLPLLAGVLIDAVSASVLVVLLFAHHRGWLNLSWLLVRLARGMVFTYLMRILWQCFLFVRTDFYYVIANLFNCRNLLKDTEGFLRSTVARVIPRIRTVDQSNIPESERRVIRVYAVLWTAGRILAFILLFTVTIPLAIRYARNLGSVFFSSGYAANHYNFIDAVLLAAYFLIPLTTGFVLWIGSLLRRERT